MPASQCRVNLFTGGTLAACVFIDGRKTIQYLRQQEGESALADSRRARENHGMGQAVPFDCPFEDLNDPGISYEIVQIDGRFHDS